MIANGIISFPSSQILYIIAGFFVATGKLDFTTTILVGALGNTIGNFILYKVTVTYGEQAAQKLLPLDARAFHAIKKTFTHHGIWWLALAKLTPSLKVIMPILAGIAKTPQTKLIPILLGTSIIWATIFIELGKSFGEKFSFGSYTVVIGVIGIIVAVILYTIVAKNVEEKI